MLKTNLSVCTPRGDTHCCNQGEVRTSWFVELYGFLSVPCDRGNCAKSFCPVIPKKIKKEIRKLIIVLILIDKSLQKQIVSRSFFV